MHVHMYACMHVCMYVCVYVCVYVCMCVCMCVCVCVCVCMCVCMYVCIKDMLFACTKDVQRSHLLQSLQASSDLLKSSITSSMHDEQD